MLILILFNPSAMALQPVHYNTNGAANLYEIQANKKFLLLNVKGYQQTEDYTCGLAIVMSLLKFYGKLTSAQMNKTTELRITKEMSASVATGTTPQQMVARLEKHGFMVNFGLNGTIDLLRRNLQQSISTIVEWIDWGGHWVIVTGSYAGGSIPDKDTLFFADPSAHFANAQTLGGITSFIAGRFESMWFDVQYFNSGHLVRGIYIVAIPRIYK